MTPAADLQAAADSLDAAFRRHSAIALLNLEGVELALALDSVDDGELQALAVASALAMPGWLFRDLLLPLIDIECAAAALEHA